MNELNTYDRLRSMQRKTAYSPKSADTVPVQTLLRPLTPTPFAYMRRSIWLSCGSMQLWLSWVGWIAVNLRARHERRHLPSVAFDGRDNHAV